MSTRRPERPAPAPAPPVAIWSFVAGRGEDVFDAGPLALDGRMRGGSWSDTGLVLAGGWVTLAHPELERTRLRWVVRFRTEQGGTLVSRGSGGAGPLPDAADSYAVFVGRELVAEVAGRRWRAPVDLRDGDWHVVELGVGPRVELVADDVLLIEDDADPPVYDGTPTLLGADIDGGVAVRPFVGELAEARVEVE